MDIIATNEDFFSFLQNIGQGAYRVFRGEQSEQYQLLPKIGRHGVTRYGSSALFDTKEEKLVLDLFIQRASSYFNFKQMSQLERIAVAQHYGVPTRLLDWTYNPLVAAFFAVENECSENSRIYYTQLPKHNELNIRSEFDPFKIKSPRFYFPNHIDERIRYQKGLFIVCSTPYKPLVLKALKSVIIHNSYRRRLKYLLYTLGIHHATIYPGIEGIAKNLYWLRTDIY